jgi:hypothetical protein
VWPPTIGNLTQRQERLLMLAERAEAYVKQEQQNGQQHDRPDNFGSVTKSRQDAFH